MAHAVQEDDDGTGVIRTIPARRASLEGDKDAMGKTVLDRIDLENLPPLTETQRAGARAAMPDSDIPQLDGSCRQQAMTLREAMLRTLQN